MAEAAGNKVICPKCGAEVEANTPGTVQCSKCGYTFTVTSIRCPSCGSPFLMPEEAGAAICPSCGSKIAKCPSCGAPFKIPATVETATCPYCGTTFKAILSRAEVSEQQHFFFPLDARDPVDLLLRFLSREYGAPPDLKENAGVETRLLHYVPVYFYYIHGIGEGVDKKSRRFRVEEVRFIGIPAVDNEAGRLLKGYSFPVRGKRFFEERFIRRGRYYEPELSKEEADKTAENMLEDLLRREAEESCEKLASFTVTKAEVSYRGLVHYPVWEIHYTYNGESYRGFVDGADGRVIIAWYPQTRHAREAATGMGLGMLGIGILAGAVLSPFTGGLSMIGGIVAGIAGAIPMLRRASHRVAQASQIHELRGKESLTGTLKKAKKIWSLGFYISG